MFLQKWKQLSRLQRSLILFTGILLFICGIASYPTVTEHLRGKVLHIFNVLLWACCQQLQLSNADMRNLCLVWTEHAIEQLYIEVSAGETSCCFVVKRNKYSTTLQQIQTTCCPNFNSSLYLNRFSGSFEACHNLPLLISNDQLVTSIKA